MTIKNLILDAIAKAFVTVKNEIQPQIDELDDNLGGLIVVESYSGTLSNGALANLACPTGVNFTDYYLPIIQGEYVSGQTTSSTAHSYTVQTNGDTAFHLYARDGTALATGYVNVRAFFIHK